MTLRRKLLHAYDIQGLPGLLRHVTKKPQVFPDPQTHPFDLLNHVDTSGYIPGDKLPSNSPADLYSTAYYAISPSTLEHALQLIPADLSTCTFIDLGCGKGRALLVAAAFPFAKIVGIELSPELAETARRNTMPYPQITIQAGDAATAQYPPGPVVIFLYHPFLSPVLRKTLRNLDRQFQGNPRKLFLLNANPGYPKVFAGFPFLHHVWTREIPLSAEDAKADRHGITSERYTLWRASQ